MNTQFPKTTDWALGTASSLLAVGAAITLIGAIVPVFVTGFKLITTATGLKYLWTVLSALVEVLSGLLGLSSAVIVGIGLLAAAIVAAGVAIYEHWGHLGEFFAGLWRDIEGGFSQFVGWVDGWSGGSATAAVNGIKAAWGGLARAFAAQWDLVKPVFSGFASWLDGWAGALPSRILTGITSGWSGLTGGVHELVGRLSSTFDNSRLGRLLGLADKAAQAGSGTGTTAAPPGPLAAAVAGAPGASGTVNVRIQTDPGTRVTAASASPGINVQAPARGATLARP